VASPTMIPPPPPPVAPRPSRSIAGPVVLIILGVLFLLGTMGMLELRSIARLFAHFWPALLILWGLIKLVEYEQAKRAGLPARGIGVGGIFLLLFLIGSGLVATQIARVDWKNIGEHVQLGDDEDLNEIFNGAAFDYNDDLSSDLPTGATGIRILDDRGTVTVNVSDEKKLKVSWRKKVHASNQEEADRYNQKTDPTVETAGKVVTLNANVQAAGDHGVSSDIDIYVPRDMDVSVTSRRGDITIAGIVGAVQINHQRGEVNLSDLVGSVGLNIERSAARLQHIKGDVTIQGRAREVDVEDIDGAVHLNGEFMESVRLVHVTKTVGFHSSRTDMEFARLDGRLDLDSGDLRADSLAGPMHLTTHSKDIALEGLSGDLRLSNNNGSVNVTVQKPGNLQIDNHKGDVQLAIPPNTALKIEARTHEGEIESDFEEIKVENEHRQSSASGSIGTNGPRVAINCDRGTIEIRRGTVAVAPPVPPAVPAVPGHPGKPAGKALPAPKAAPVESEN
jgi:DUF4097 and DUF4098 domain-containing protein YvlB